MHWMVTNEDCGGIDWLVSELLVADTPRFETGTVPAVPQPARPRRRAPTLMAPTTLNMPMVEIVPLLKKDAPASLEAAHECQESPLCGRTAVFGAQPCRLHESPVELPGAEARSFDPRGWELQASLTLA